MIAIVIDHAADAACQPATCPIGLRGLGDVGSAVTRVTGEAADHLPQAADRIHAVLDALPSATAVAGAAFPALAEEAHA